MSLYLHDIILSSQVEHLPPDVEGDDGQRRDLLTVDEVLQRRQRTEECCAMIHQPTAEIKTLSSIVSS